MVLNRADVISKLESRKPIKDLFEDLENRTGVTIEFQSLGKDETIAKYDFQQPDHPIILLRSDWEEVDVAHELMHMKIELIDGYSVLAWRRGVPHDSAVGRATHLIRLGDDVIVHELLRLMGLQVDGEIIRPSFFDDICTKITKCLKQGATRPKDRMQDFDKIDFGDLRRCFYLVFVELVLDSYGNALTFEHRELAKDFVNTFRNTRSRESKKADKILGYFKQYDINSIDGHKAILENWTKLELLNSCVGPMSYSVQGNGFVLPFPS